MLHSSCAATDSQSFVSENINTHLCMMQVQICWKFRICCGWPGLCSFCWVVGWCIGSVDTYTVQNSQIHRIEHRIQVETEQMLFTPWIRNSQWLICVIYIWVTSFFTILFNRTGDYFGTFNISGEISCYIEKILQICLDKLNLHVVSLIYH